MQQMNDDCCVNLFKTSYLKEMDKIAEILERKRSDLFAIIRTSKE